MSNPTFINISNDDTVWIYDATEAEYLEAMDPAKTEDWFTNNVMNKNPTGKVCGKRSPMRPVDTLNLPGDRSFQLMGICGTSIVLANGSPEAILRNFLAPRHTELRTMRSPAGLEATAFLLSNPDSYFDQLDSRIAYSPNVKPGLDLVIHEVKKLAYIHVDLGTDPAIYLSFGVACERFPGKFSQWLKSPSTKALDRKVIFIDKDGNMSTPIDLDPASKIDTSGMQLIPEPDGELQPCANPLCVYSACDVSSGNANDFTPGSGLVDITLEANVVKMYCRKPDGTMC